jgi:protein translocase SecG subunit
MSFFASLLTFVLVINCVLLIFLVLIQLPKKDAGAGMAFGAGAADALFGAGSGNALTKITKYSAGALIGLCLLINLMGGKSGDDNSAAAFAKQVQMQQQQQQSQQPAKAPAPAMSAPPVTTPAEAPAPAPVSTNGK